MQQLTQPGTGGSASFFGQAARQIGVDRTDDFVFGPTHEALRQRLFAGLRQRGAAEPVLAGLRGARMHDAALPEESRRAQLDAPLAVQAAPERACTFAFNKFSAMPLLIDAGCRAQAEARAAAPNDYPTQLARKQLMIVPNVHVIRLERDGDRIIRVVTNQGTLDLDPAAQVFLALGTIESTRLALRCAPDPTQLIGRNLMAHLRSNLVLRIRRDAFSEFGAELRDLQPSALFVKGVHKHGDGRLGHFHLQITASGTGAATADSEIELFKRVPDLDGLEVLSSATDEWVVVTIRGIGEMRGDRTSPAPANRVTLGGGGGPYDYGEPRALVRPQASDADQELWNVMDQASEDVALLLANGRADVVQYRGPEGWRTSPPPATQRHDSLASTHHEAGTLWMGSDPATSVTDESCRFHRVSNLFATGPALLPRIGSPNPMLSGIALVRRLAEAVVPAVASPAVPADHRALFDGTATSFAAWLTADAEPQFALADGRIVAQAGSNLGLLFFGSRTFGDFDLRLQFRTTAPTDNAGVHVRFRDPRQPVPNPANPQRPFVYGRKAFVAVTTGFEVQIDDLARGNPDTGVPDGADESRTGAWYGVPIGTIPGTQAYTRPEALVPMVWNDLRIEVRGDRYRVALNGRECSRFENTDAQRGKTPADDPASGCVGIQAHTGRVEFRAIQVREMTSAPPPAASRRTGAPTARIPSQPPRAAAAATTPLPAATPKAQPPAG